MFKSLFEKKPRTLTADALRPDESYDLFDLSTAGLVQVRGSGISITAITAKITNQTTTPIRILIRPGTYFSAKGSHQNMVARHAHEQDADAGETISVRLAATCINAGRPIPTDEDGFADVYRVDENVLAFLWGSSSLSAMEIQAGVWALTDNYTGQQVRTHLTTETQSGETAPAISEDDVRGAVSLLDRLGIPHRLATDVSCNREQEDPELLDDFGTWLLHENTNMADVARKWLTKAKNGGSRYAKVHLGQTYMPDHTGQPDVSKALDHFLDAVVLDDHDAISRWAMGNAVGLLQCDESYLPVVMKRLQRKAKRDPIFMYVLGLAYADGVGLPKEPDRALGLFVRSADLGFKMALNDIAWIKVSNADLYDPRGALEASIECSLHVKDYYIVLDTLACAYAATGDFPKAVSTQRAAIELTQSDSERSIYGERLEAFKGGKTFLDMSQ